MEPRVGRPSIPHRWEYGTEPVVAPAIGWEEMAERIRVADTYWLATTRPDGRPHVVPIGGVWAGGGLYLTLAPSTVSARNASEHPAAAVHLDDANDAVIIEGSMERPRPTDVPTEAVDAYGEKYGGAWDPADVEMPFWLVRPRLVMTWRSDDIRGSAVRWRFD